MCKENNFRKYLMLCTCLCISIFLSACGATLKHVPSMSLNAITVQQPVSIMVADIGDERDGEYPTRIGQGVSWWLPLSYYACDEEGKDLPVSYYIAKSLSEDLAKLGYRTKLANDVRVRKPLSLVDSIDIAKQEGADYIVTTKVKDAKTNFWGYIIIPFFQPVWTRIAYDSQLIDTKAENDIIPFQTNHKETEWYFAKITVFDAIFDAGIFGKHWHSKAWGETVVSDALAETTINISEKIQSRDNAVLIKSPVVIKSNCPIDKSERRMTDPKKIIVKYNRTMIFFMPGYSTIVSTKTKGSVLTYSAQIN